MTLDEQRLQQIEDAVQRYRAALEEHGATTERFEAAEAELDASDTRRGEIERELRDLVGVTDEPEAAAA